MDKGHLHRDPPDPEDLRQAEAVVSASGLLNQAVAIDRHRAELITFFVDEMPALKRLDEGEDIVAEEGVELVRAAQCKALVGYLAVPGDLFHEVFIPNGVPMAVELADEIGQTDKGSRLGYRPGPKIPVTAQLKERKSRIELVKAAHPEIAGQVIMRPFRSAGQIDGGGIDENHTIVVRNPNAIVPQL